MLPHRSLAVPDRLLEHYADEWSGGAWLTTDAASAVIFVGTKGLGKCWYGLPDGTVWPDQEPYPEDPLNQRGM